MKQSEANSKNEQEINSEILDSKQVIIKSKNIVIWANNAKKKKYNYGFD